MLSLIANMPPPNYRIEIPEGQREWFEVAPGLFLSLAFAFGGWYLLRYRSIRSTAARVSLLLGLGSLALWYTAQWIWSHESPREVISHNFSAALADDMPYVWLLFCLAGYVALRIYFRKETLRPEGTLPFDLHWTDKLLVALSCCATFLSCMIPLGRTSTSFRPLCVFWVCAFILWGLIVGVVFGVRFVAARLRAEPTRDQLRLQNLKASQPEGNDHPSTH